MDKIREFAVFLVLIGMGVLVSVTEMPETLVDLLLFPLSCIALYLFANELVKMGVERPENGDPTLRERVGRLILGTVIFLPLLAWSVYAGVKNPIGYFTGVRGALHGYTLIPLGCALLVMWLCIARGFYLTRGRKKHA
jgi:hypothetical protein